MEIALDIYCWALLNASIFCEDQFIWSEDERPAVKPSNGAITSAHIGITRDITLYAPTKDRSCVTVVGLLQVLKLQIE